VKLYELLGKRNGIPLYFMSLNLITISLENMEIQKKFI